MDWHEVIRSVEHSRKLLEALWNLDGEAVAEGIDRAHEEISILQYNDENALSCTINLTLKGKSALLIFDKHANLKYKYGNRHFWAEGYYVSTVGMNEATIKKYIEDQDKHDIALDKLSVKEYEDPFKGSK